MVHTGTRTLTEDCIMKYSKIFSALAISILIVGCSQNDKPNEQAIRDAIKNYQDAYNQQDADKLTAIWGSHASYKNPITGKSAVGREAIRKLYQESFAKDKKVHLEIVNQSIEFPSTNEAIEKGVMKVSSQDAPPKQLAYQANFIKENGKWFLDSIGEIELQVAPTNFEQLKDLSWMVGNWEDSDENIQILFTNKWDTNKNFLTENFKMKIYGHDDIQGYQIIGWDPIKNVIRSWVFDSDGGFGEGTWEKFDKSWYVTLQFTLSDGRLASSKNIYTPIDANSYTFTSTDREIDGEILPNTDPVTVEKIKQVAP